MRGDMAHGVFMANNNGMDVILTNNRLTYKMIGGIIDLYFFMGPTVEEVTKQYHSIIGLPALPPYWALGFHQSRWGYSSVQELENVVQNFHDNELPFDTIWSDIDYMDDHKLWTLNPLHYNERDLSDFVDQLHDSHLQYVIIIDPGVKQEDFYEPWEDGLEREIFIKNPIQLNSSAASSYQDGEAFTGKVWPGFVSFIDFYHPDATAYWYDHMSSFYDKIPFDGLWIDMNEIASFCDGHCILDISANGDNIDYNAAYYDSDNESFFECICDHPFYNDLDFPPYFIGDHSPDTSTISMASMHYDNQTEYNLHNLYGYLETKATKEVLIQLRNQKRAFVLSRSSFAGSGTHGAHWLGDNTATWDDLRYSISGLISMNLFGIPFVGADVCGFNGDTTAELCARWMQLGVFYPFYRNHNGFSFISQEPYVFSKTITDVNRYSLQLRYSLISFYYSKLFEVSLYGGMFIDSLAFLFPNDIQCKSIDSQFMVGKSLMVAPVLQSSSISYEHNVYFPKTTWYNYFTGEIILRDQFIQSDNEDHDNNDNVLGKWIQFNTVHIDSLFLFIKGGSIVFSQDFGTNAFETKSNPISFIIALPHDYDIDDDRYEDHNKAFSSLYIDDGESIDYSTDYNQWDIEAWYGDDGVGRVNVTRKLASASYSPIVLKNITIYGVPPPCSIVLVNNTETEFIYRKNERTLVILLDRKLDRSFIVLWGEKESTQPFMERFDILVACLVFTVSLLSIVSLIIFGFRKKYPNCKPPEWCHIPHVRDVPEYRLANTSDTDDIEIELQEIETEDDDDIINEEIETI